MHTFLFNSDNPKLKTHLHYKKQIIKGDGPLAWKVLATKCGKVSSEATERVQLAIKTMTLKTCDNNISIATENLSK